MGPVCLVHRTCLLSTAQSLHAAWVNLRHDGTPLHHTRTASLARTSGCGLAARRLKATTAASSAVLSHFLAN